MAAYGFTYTLPVITGSHADFPVVMTTGCFPASAVDGGATSIINGGGNLRAYTDSSKATQLPVDVIKFVTGGTPDVHIFVKTQAVTGGTIYIEADEVETIQPPAGSTYGRNSVYPDDLLMWHGDSTTPTDSTGNLSGSVTGTLTAVAGHHASIDAVNFANKSNINFGITADSASDLHLSAWIKPNSTNVQGDIIARRLGSNWNWEWRLESLDDAILIGSSSPNNPAAPLPVGVWVKLGLDVSGSTITFYRNGISTGTASVTGSRTGSDYVLTVGSFDTSNSALSVLSDMSNIRVRESSVSAGWELTEYENQSNPDTWGTSSAWSDGSVVVTSNGTFTVTNPIFSGSVTASLPQPVSDVLFTLSSLLVNGSVTATLPSPVSDGAFTVGPNLFNGSVSVTLPQPIATGAFTLVTPVLNGNASVTSPNPVTNGSFALSSLGFGGSATVTQPTPTSNGSFTISGFEFLGSASATLPNPVVNGQFTLGAPLFSGSVSVITASPIGSGDFTIGQLAFTGTAVVTVPSPAASGGFTISAPLFVGSVSIGGGFIQNTTNIIRVDSLDNIIAVDSPQNIIVIT